jgi:pimeloyl-ACP methyl ester carboxylesterase
MFTDVVGYTSITERDEATAVRIRESHRTLVETLVAQFDGEVVDVTGDESLSIFPSALRAVDCAMALQGALRSYPDLTLRIGIHLGDVLRRGNEVIGEGVNVAARIRPLAEPGGICVSEPVYQMVRSRTHVTARSIGEQALKNVSVPLTLYALSTEEPTAESEEPSRTRVRWVAALAGVALIAAVVFVYRGPLIAWVALKIPVLLSNPIDQEIGFASTADGVRIAYATTGEGPPLVFVLGWGTHLQEGMGSPLYDQAGFLNWYSREHLVVRYDGRGFGLSDWDVTDFSLEARVRDVEAVVDALGLERFDLYAYSNGGPTGVAYAARHPERVSRLVLAATFARPASGFDEEQLRELGELARFVGRNWESTTARAAFAEYLAPEASAIERNVLMHFLKVSGDGSAFLESMRASGDIDVSEQARTIRQPTLVVASDTDTTVPLAASRDLASLIPGARFELLPGASHIGASAQDPRLMQLVSDFLRAPEAAP